MADKSTPEKQAEGAKVQTSEGTKHAQGTAADALPSTSQVDKGVQQAEKNAEGQSVSR